MQAGTQRSGTLHFMCICKKLLKGLKASLHSGFKVMSQAPASARIRSHPGTLQYLEGLRQL